MSEQVNNRLMKLETIVEEHCKSNDRQFSDIKDGLKNIEVKLDNVIDKKADKTEVSSMRSQIWALFASVLVAMGAAIIDLLKK